MGARRLPPVRASTIRHGEHVESYAVVARRCEEVSDGVVAFDEVLDNANLGRCRSTGVIIGGKLAQYNLSLPVPNELILDVVAKIRQKIELLHVDASIVVVNKPRDLLVRAGPPPRRAGADEEAEARRRVLGGGAGAGARRSLRRVARGPPFERRGLAGVDPAARRQVPGPRAAS